ncbi:MAG: YlxR family protein [Actinobacteria bacterium]|nr:YlxR family protein [Actinomycetota bacterium]
MHQAPPDLRRRPRDRAAGDRTTRPRRTCVGCRTTRDKDELLRLAATPDGVRADPAARLPGRGAYVCPTTACIETAAHRNAVRRALHGTSEDEVRTALETLLATVSTSQAPKEQHA